MSENMCQNCGCIDEELVELVIDGETKQVCADCAHSLGFTQCSECGEWIPADDAILTDDDEAICESCYEDWYTTCEDCGAVIRADDARLVNPNTRRESLVCESCADSYNVCDDCGELYSDEYVYSDNYGHVVCHHCFENNDWACCDRCGELILADDAYWSDSVGGYLCYGCYDRYGNSFHDYGYKPEPIFKFRTSETTKGDQMDSVLTFGVELEVDDGDDHDELSDELAGLGEPIYMKHDGSLGEEGVEIVTHPCSLAYHLYELRWAEIARICRNHDYTSHNAGTCGLHIHIGRRQMGEDWVARDRVAGNIVLLVNSIWDELVKFSRRTESQLSDWSARPELELDENEHLTDGELTGMALHTKYHGRYQAVNLCNSETVELRIFRGTLKRSTIAATIQLASNLTKYAMTHTPTECRTATFGDVVSVQEFKELKAYCESRGL